MLKANWVSSVPMEPDAKQELDGCSPMLAKVCCMLDPAPTLSGQGKPGGSCVCLSGDPEVSAAILQDLEVTRIRVGRQGTELGVTILSAPIRLRSHAECPGRGTEWERVTEATPLQLVQRSAENSAPGKPVVMTPPHNTCLPIKTPVLLGRGRYLLSVNPHTPAQYWYRPGAQ